MDLQTAERMRKRIVELCTDAGGDERPDGDAIQSVRSHRWGGLVIRTRRGEVRCFATQARFAAWLESREVQR